MNIKIDCPVHERSEMHHQQRRGVVLLVVVSLLALFVLLGVTYTLAVSQYHQASLLERQVQRVGDQPETETDIVLGQIVFDTLARTSLQHHSLLADLYGMDGIAGVVTGSTAANPTPTTGPPPTGGQILVIQANVDVPGEQIYNNTSITAFSSVPDYYSGRVLTFKSGPLVNKSTRIIHYTPADTAGGIPARFYLDMPLLRANAALTPNANDKFIVNGAPFNGTGFGYVTGGANRLNNGQTPVVSNLTPTEPYAYLPHFSGYSTAVALKTDLAAGGMDESYDATDFQNLAISMVPPGRATNNALPLIPSFHRPELVAYWLSRFNPTYLDSGTPPQPDVASATNGPIVRAFLRQFIFRPMWWDHPNFTGSNPYMTQASGAAQTFNNLQSVRGTWDVDNDGDGVPDSIWIDPGLPVITTPEGRRYKRLAAILIKDLDGRINVNVHGNTQQQANSGQHRTNSPISLTASLAGQSTTAPVATNYYLPRGLGYGPAEVDFQHILLSGIATPTPAQTSSAVTAYQNILNSRYSRLSETSPGVIGDDVLSLFRNLGLPNNYTTSFNYQWASPPDVWGRGVVALDYYGQPTWGLTTLATGETTDDPYEMQYDHSRAPADEPYQPRELERILRYHDVDTQSMYSRLLDPGISSGFLGDPTGANGDQPGTIGASHTRREMLTTMSYSLPVPPGIYASDKRTTLTQPPGFNSILDLYYQKIVAAGVTTVSTPNISQVFDQIVAFELRRGEQFNINRPLGNGMDDNGNFVTDEPLEAATQEHLNGVNTNPTIEKANDSVFTSATFPAFATFTDNQRQAFARHLYCLMMLLADTNWQMDLDGDGTPSALEAARYLAQFAVNVIDFRDADSIMTRFDFDPTPFDGWNPDGSTYVWGAERPELLITETLAFHDRRTEDRGNEAANMGETQATTSAASNPDTDYDQRLRPVGSCFIELYNPWFDSSATAANNYNGYQRLPWELYKSVPATSGGARTTGVVLDELTPTGYPVWRILVVQGASHNAFTATPTFNPDFPRPNAGIAAADVDRTIFFADPANLVTAGDPFVNINSAYFSSLAKTTSTASTLSVLTPGQYAIVGSSGTVVSGTPSTYTTYVGRKQSDTSDNDFWQGPPTASKDTTRQIVLTPGVQRTNGSTTQVEFQIKYNSGATNEIPANLGKQPIAIPIDRPRSLNITQPLTYSPPGTSVLTATAFPFPDDFEYLPPIDTPLDQGATGIDLHRNGTYPNVRTLVLQRLADPTQDWNPNSNPYLTVDRSSADVTAFNGVTLATDPGNAASTTRNFQTFQRGGSHTAAAWDAGATFIDNFRHLWPHTSPRINTPTISGQAEATVGPHMFTQQLLHTFGYLNTRYEPRITTGVYAGAPDVLTGTQTSAFPWLTFNNRPFMNPSELLLVPVANQYGLLANFSIRTTATAGAEYNTFATPHAHLLNFFQATTDTTSTPNINPSNLCRLFDFINVPSPFIHADSYFNYANFATGQPSTDQFSVEAALRSRPPFHKISRFREPGKVNINTVFDDNLTAGSMDLILQGVFKGNPSMDSAAAQNPTIGQKLVSDLKFTRQGHAGNSTTLYTMPVSPSVVPPSMFFNPYRAQDASDLIPGNTSALPPVTAGLLRPNSVTQSAGVQTVDPLFAYTSAGQGYEHEDTNRNPYFRYQRLQRAGSLLTNQSNCFAIWITIGYFEVEASATGVDAAHPEGLSLAQEVGADSGQVTRHRAFYIIDRSVPVGFIPGSKLNTDDCILVRRLIE